MIVYAIHGIRYIYIFILYKHMYLYVYIYIYFIPSISIEYVLFLMKNIAEPRDPRFHAFPRGKARLWQVGRLEPGRRGSMGLLWDF